MAKHTPAPWHRSAGTTIMTDEECGQSVALMNVRRGEWEANANLIAAAPDLLAVCVDILESLDNKMRWTSVSRKFAANDLRAAIAKARGES